MICNARGSQFGGWKLCQTIPQNPKWQGVPWRLLTGHSRNWKGASDESAKIRVDATTDRLSAIGVEAPGA